LKEGIEMRPPESVDKFNDIINEIRIDRAKAANLLFEDFEHEINEKESFLRS